MRYCTWCKKPMNTSNESIWVAGENYDIHVPCKKEAESKCDNCGKRRIDHIDYFDTGRKNVCPHRCSINFVSHAKDGGQE